MARPIPFIQYNESDHKFFVDEKATAILSGIRGKIAVVAVSGPYRTGKSYLLNCLIGGGQQVGFDVGGTIEACTKGIWLWGQPQKVGDTTVIFMDTEGLGSLDQDQHFDTQVFSLAILLSSFFVLNTQGTINETALEQLELVVECTKSIKLRDDSKEENGSAELSQIFPSFLWVLRDFVLELKDREGKQISPRQYLENALQVVPSGSRSSEKNRIRQAVTGVFPDRDCVCLVRPVSDEKQLQTLARLPPSAVRPEFTSQIETLRQSVLNKAVSKPKQLDGQIVNGPALLSLAKAYTTAINAGAMPVINSAWQMVIAQQGHEALDSALAVFTQAVQTSTHSASVYEESALDQLLSTCESSGMDVLRERALGDAATVGRLEDRFRGKTRNIRAERVALNQAKSADTCRALIHHLWDQSGLDAAGSDGAAASQWKKRMAKLREQYLASAAGPAKESIWSTFTDGKQATIVARLGEAVVHLRSQLETQQKQAEELKDSLTRKLHELESQVLRSNDRLEEARTRLGREEAAHSEARNQLQQAQREADSIKIHLSHSQENAKRLEAQIAEARNQIDRLNTQCAESQRANERLSAQLSEKHREMERLQQSCSDAQRDIQRYQMLQTQAVREGEALSAQLAEMKRQSEQTVAQLSARVKEVEASRREAEAQCAEYEREQTESKAREAELMLEKARWEAERNRLSKSADEGVTHLRNTVAAAERQVQQLQQSLRQLEQARADDLRHVSEEKSRSATAHRQELSSWENRVEEAHRQRAAVESQLTAAESRVAELVAARSTLEERLRSVSSGTASAETRLRSQLSRMEDRAQQAESETARLKKELSAATEQRQAGQEEVSTLKRQLQQAEKEAKAARVKLEAELQAEKRRVEQAEAQAREAKASSAAAAAAAARPAPAPVAKPAPQRAPSPPVQMADEEQPEPEIEQPDVVEHNAEEDAEEEDDEKDVIRRSNSFTESLGRRSFVADFPAPAKCTVEQLKSWLTRLDVELPGSKQKKDVYLKMLYDADPGLQNAEAAEPVEKKAAARRGTKRKAETAAEDEEAAPPAKSRARR